MRISRIQIRQFRNFSELNIALGNNTVIVGDNKIGKSNLLYALRLVLDPSLPDSARRLREEDFWDGLERPLGKDDRIVISVDLSEFEEDENQLAVLADHLVEPDPMVARLTYVWQPLPGLDDGPRKESDYEFLVYGGDRPENRFSYQARQRIPMDVMPALRDCEGDLARWSRSPLRPLLDKAAGQVDPSKLQTLADGVDAATAELTKVKEVKAVSKSIEDKLIEMIGKGQALEPTLRFSPTDADKLIRALRIFIDDGIRSISEASLGSANLLYFALKTLEYEQMVADGDRDHTFLAIEEPEAHLHPNLQRLVFRNYLRSRGARQEDSNGQSSTILVTTHSPHIVSVTPLRDLVVLRRNADGDASEAISTAEINLEDREVEDLERYIDVNRGEILFARGIILVEGDAERFLIPVLAKNQGYDLDELGISVCSISGTNFYPYLLLFGPRGLGFPIAALTDCDPRPPDNVGVARPPLSRNRVIQMTRALCGDDVIDDEASDATIASAPSRGVFVNTHTLEVDLYCAGLHEEIAAAFLGLSTSRRMKSRVESWWANSEGHMDPSAFLKDVETVGKGRFAQRLASNIAESKTGSCPEYISEGVKHVAGRCMRV